MRYSRNDIEHQSLCFSSIFEKVFFGKIPLVLVWCVLVGKKTSCVSLIQIEISGRRQILSYFYKPLVGMGNWKSHIFLTKSCYSPPPPNSISNCLISICSFHSIIRLFLSYKMILNPRHKIDYPLKPITWARNELFSNGIKTRISASLSHFFFQKKTETDRVEKEVVKKCCI